MGNSVRSLSVILVHYIFVLFLFIRFYYMHIQYSVFLMLLSYHLS